MKDTNSIVALQRGGLDSVSATHTEHHVWGILLALIPLIHGSVVLGNDAARDRAATGLRTSLKFYAERQYRGGWASHYSVDLTKQWGEWRPTHANVVTISDSGMTGIGLIFVRAAEVLNEPRWLSVACKAGDLLVAGQLPNGGFTQELQITSAGVKGVHQLLPYPKAPRAATQGVLENNTTDRAIELLCRLVDATGQQQYGDAARRAVDFLVTAQYPCGAFPQRYPPSNGYDKYYTLNDGATTDSILRLISFYRRTEETKYLNAARKGGEWILSAVLPDPTPGWAEQYDELNEPARARLFEPPGVGTEVTYLAVEALTELYLITGDAKYLPPAEKALAWLQHIQISPGGRCYRLYEITSGKPIFVERTSGQVYYDIEELPENQRPRWYCGPFFGDRPSAHVSVMQIWQCLRTLGREGLLAQRLRRTGKLDIESGYGAFRTPAIETEKDRTILAQQVETILAQQQSEGWWSGECDGTTTISSSVFTRNAIELISYLQMDGVVHHSSGSD